MVSRLYKSLLSIVRYHSGDVARRTLISRVLLLAFAGTTLTLGMPSGRCQSSEVKPEFEVATVKPNASGCCTSSRWSADQVVFRNQTLGHLIIFAYKLQPQQLIGPEWMESTRFDITAKYPVGTRFSDRLLMLQTLLQERFKLVVHRETKQMPAFELLVATSGFKLKPSEPGEGSYVSGEQGGTVTFRAYKLPMFDVAYELSDTLGKVVVDRTGLGDAYTFQISFAANDLGIGDSGDAKGVPTLFEALHDSLGLRLQYGKTAVPVISVDHLERMPSEN